MLVEGVRVKGETAAYKPIPLDARIPQIHQDMRGVQRKEREAPRNLEGSQSRKGFHFLREMEEEE